ncbi:MAG: phage tail protein [Anaerolineaceae bacterium]|nr:phage tail protein [Anaerolineaceae bacterium]
MAALGKRQDPYAGYNFRVEIKGLIVAGFTEVNGLQVEIEVKEYQEGGLNAYIHKLPGVTRYPSNLILKRGITSDDLLWKWHYDVTQGRIKRSNGSVILFNDAGEEKIRWNFLNAYPIRWIGPQFNANSASVAVETIELVHTGMVKA